MLNFSKPAGVPARSGLIDAPPTLVEELQRLGWHVALTRARLAVHVTFPDGRPAKIAAAFVGRRPGASRRPWSVVAPGLPKAVAFRTFEEAAAIFLEQMRLRGPAPAPRRRRGVAVLGMSPAVRSARLRPFRDAEPGGIAAGA